MKGNLLSASGNMIPTSSYGSLHLQDSMQVDYQQNQQSHMNTHYSGMASNFVDSNKNCNKGKTYSSCSYDGSNLGEGFDGSNDHGREKNESQRVKWTDNMVKLLIIAVSYLAEDVSGDCNGGGGRRSSVNLQKKGKWKCISKAMAERGHHVSPQQCEDKFNDLNKRYKRLNDILGRGTSCKVVEDPKILDTMSLSGKAKEAVRKILNSKQLFYEEMCSYNNRNQLYLPHDPSLQRSLHLALGSKERLNDFEEEEEDDQVAESGDQDDEIEVDRTSKRMKLWEDCEIGFGKNREDKNRVATTDCRMDEQVNKQLISRSLVLEERKLEIQAQKLDLEKQQIRWRMFCAEEDRELDKTRLQNKCLKLANAQLALEIKYRRMSADHN